jgi:hypothetical protein
MARRSIRHSNGAVGGNGLALFGLITGYVNVAISSVVIAAWLSLI